MKLASFIIAAASAVSAFGFKANRIDPPGANNFFDPGFDQEFTRVHPAAYYTNCELITAGTVGLGNSTDGNVNDRFGYRIATNDDYVAISAPFREDCTGIIYMYQNINQDIELVQTVYSPDKSQFHLFGEAMAMDGNYMVASSRRINQNAGKAYVFKLDGGAWTDIATIDVELLAANDGNTKGDTFGWAVAIKNGIIAVSSAGDDVRANQNGAVYMFKINDSQDGVDYITKLYSPQNSPALPKESFGQALALSDAGTLVVGAYRSPSSETGYSNDSPDEAGYVYVYEMTTGPAWNHLASIRPQDNLPGDRFGFSVDIVGSIIAVGADGFPSARREGKVYIYEISGNQVTLEEEIQPTDVQEGDGFGTEVRFGSATTLIVGAHFADTGKDENQFVYHGGSAWLYEIGVAGWELKGRATPDGQEERDYMGHAVDFFTADLGLGPKSYFILGATGDDLDNIATKSHAGAAYMCEYIPSDITPDRPCDDFKEKLDILWVLDTSGSIDDYEFYKAQKFLKKVSRNFTLGEDDTRFAFVPFSTSVDSYHVVYFTDPAATSGGKWRRWIRDLCRWPGWTDIPEALIYSYKFIFTESVKRDDSTNVVVVLTDGAPNRRTGCFSEFNELNPVVCSRYAAAELVREDGDDVYFIYMPIGDQPDDPPQGAFLELFEGIEDARFETSINQLLEVLDQVVEEIQCEDSP